MADYDALVERNVANVQGELGQYFDEWHSKMREIAYTSASTYFKIQRRFSDALLVNITTNVERVIFNCITRGITIDGNPIIMYGVRDRPDTVPDVFYTPGDPRTLQPRMPVEKARQISLSFAKTFADNVKTKILNELFPPDILSSALNRTRERVAPA